MPFGNGTGPVGGGRDAGRGLGRGIGRSRQPGGFGLGGGGECVCPKCGTTTPIKQEFLVMKKNARNAVVR